MKALTIRLSALCLALSLFSLPDTLAAAGKHELDASVKSALSTLYSQVNGARELGNAAVGILVFPKVNKAGMLVGSEYGEGAMLEDGMTTGYYSTFSASVGIQLGAQVKSQAFMFMTKEALDNFKNTEEWTVGADGAVAAPDVGPNSHVSPEAVSEPILAFTFSTKGIMLGGGIEGNKIKRIEMLDLAGVKFALNSADLTPASRTVLDNAVATIKSRDNINVEVAAHTCNVGEVAYNKALSDRRAESVMQYLVSQGISADRLTARGYGATQPVASNDTRPGRIQNRRVELRLTDGHGGVPAFNK